jgi:GNAT superfamily N-acetyltransferase
MGQLCAVSPNFVGSSGDHVCMTVTARLTTGHPLFAEAVEVFDDYRQHYGANPAPEAVERWMRELMSHDSTRIYLAGPGDRVLGLCSVSVVPAALTLRTAWVLRDLYVDPDGRRTGVARALLAHIAEAARAEGAHRLLLQTETGNLPALELYRRAGFEPVADVIALHRLL